MTKAKYITSYITCREIKHSNLKMRIVKLDIFIRTKHSTRCSLQEMKIYTLNMRKQHRKEPVGDMKWCLYSRSLKCEQDHS